VVGAATGYNQNKMRKSEMHPFIFGRYKLFFTFVANKNPTTNEKESNPPFAAAHAGKFC
jgi:hypothetical protein